MLFQHLPYLSTKSFLLGSGSPRRKELLEQMGLSFVTRPSGFAEDLDKSSFSDAAGYVLETSKKKAEYLQEELQEKMDAIICADTVVVVPMEEETWKILEKPEDKQKAKEMISTLSGKYHYVITAVHIILPKRNNECISFAEKTKVFFSQLEEEEIEAYVQTDEPYDKAGGYGIQGKAGCFVEKIDGCYYNVMGLPIHALSKIIADLVCEGKI